MNDAPETSLWFQPLLGARFDNRFRIDQHIGDGGYGTVFAGFDEKMQRAVAVKCIPDQKVSTAQLVSEAQRLAGLNHPGILTAFDHGEHRWERGLLPYLVTEFLPASLNDLRTEADGRVPLDEAIRITRQVLDALGRAHELGVVHRDLHSNNVLIDELGNARIIDFGLAKAIGTNKSRVSVLAGVDGYIAPERYNDGEDAAIPDDPRSDLWSVGVLLIEMVTNEVPWRVTHSAHLAYAASADPHIKLVEVLNDPALAPLDAFLDHLLAKKPEDRPATAYAAADELNEVARQIRSSAPASIPVSSGVTTMRDHGAQLRENRSSADRVSGDKPTVAPDHNFWFVNQGISYEAERSQGILGSGTVHWTHKTMRELEVGDRVFHHAGGRIVAIGRVTQAADEVRPGRLEAKVEYTSLDEPIRVSDIPLEVREREQTQVGGPFRRDGKAHQGYLFRVGSGFADALAGQFGDALAALR